MQVKASEAATLPADPSAAKPAGKESVAVAQLGPRLDTKLPEAQSPGKECTAASRQQTRADTMSLEPQLTDVSAWTAESHDEQVAEMLGLELAAEQHMSPLMLHSPASSPQPGPASLPPPPPPPPTTSVPMSHSAAIYRKLPNPASMAASPADMQGAAEGGLFLSAAVSAAEHCRAVTGTTAPAQAAVGNVLEAVLASAAAVTEASASATVLPDEFSSAAASMAEAAAPHAAAGPVVRSTQSAGQQMPVDANRASAPMIMAALLPASSMSGPIATVAAAKPVEHGESLRARRPHPRTAPPAEAASQPLAAARLMPASLPHCTPPTAAVQPPVSFIARMQEAVTAAEEAETAAIEEDSAAVAENTSAKAAAAGRGDKQAGEGAGQEAAGEAAATAAVAESSASVQELYGGRSQPDGGDVLYEHLAAVLATTPALRDCVLTFAPLSSHIQAPAAGKKAPT